MKKHYILIFIGSCMLQMLSAQTIWTGPKTTFTKANHADWTLEANQDRITDNVWITRQNSQGIFNIKVESRAAHQTPTDTEWAFGTTNDINSLTFTYWKGAANSNPSSLVNKNMVLHLISENIYIDIKFLSWTQGDGGNGGGGGGFSYERSTPTPLSIGQNKIEKILLSPNPANNVLSIKGIKTKESYTIFSLLGKVVQQGQISRGEQIQIDKLSKGLYFLKLKDRTALKFIKQ